MLYGAVATGLGKTAMSAVRAEALHTTGMAIAGQSTTAAIAVVLGELADPAVKLPIAVIMQWLQLSKLLIKDTPGLPSLWRLAAKHLKDKGEQKWHYVKGPMAATIATIMDAGWEPEEWNLWLDSFGVAWQLSEESNATINAKTCDTLLRSFRRDLRCRLWAQSTSNTFLCNKLPHTKSVREQWLKLQKQGKHGEAKLLIRVFGGGLWTSQRVAEAHLRSKPLDEERVPQPTEPLTLALAEEGGATMQKHSDKSSPHCRLCGAAVQDLWHTAYECRPVLDKEQFKDSEPLIESAHKHRGHNSALWLHGCCSGLHDEVPLPGDQEQVEYWPQENWQPGTYYSDASGGEHSADPILRRAGVGACSLARVCDVDGQFSPAISCYLKAPLPGPAQTINRGELYAIIKLLQHIVNVPGKITTIITDSQYCVTGYRAGESAQQARWNDDLWDLFFSQVRRLDGQVHLIKVKSHLEIQDVILGHVLLRDVTGNAMADCIARQAADSAAIDEKVAQNILIKIAHSKKVMKHLVCTTLEYLRQLEELGLRDREAQQPKPREKRQGKDRGHQLVRHKSNQWRCKHCLSVRSSKLAYRWPKTCSGVFKQVPLAKHPTGGPEPFGGPGPPQVPLVQSAPVALNPLDDPEADIVDDFDCEDVDIGMLPPDETEVISGLGAASAEVPAADFTSSMPVLAASEGSWWNKEGEHIGKSDLKIGGAPLHHSHWLGWFGNSTHRVVFCARCGGTTAGAFSPLLARPCKQQAAETSRRHLARMVVRSSWPTQAMEQQWGRGTCSHIIAFRPQSNERCAIYRPGGRALQGCLDTIKGKEFDEHCSKVCNRDTGPNPWTNPDT